MSAWEPYFGERKIKKCDGYVVIVPEKEKHSLPPTFCDVCEIRLFSKEDEEAYKKFECCSSCADTWAYSRSKEWKNGWRPSKETVNAAIQKRIFVNKNITFE
jgi:hypothetical protein